jgi:malate dehydrogenase (oxaloacetate-decarboxylating)(NADP+)
MLPTHRSDAGPESALPQGAALLQDPALNKGLAFDEAERDRLHLRGLLPPHVLSQAQQVERVLENLRSLPSDLDRFVALRALQDRNETLFFRLLMEYPDEMTPIVYTPTVGLACQRYAHIYQHPHGLFVSAADRGRVADLLENWPRREVSMIVVSDGERILGLGDLGAGGMGIPVGKLALYTACAGIPPGECLPVLLDVGTDNEALRNDPLYIGLHQPRLRGDDYDDLVDEFVTAAGARFPGVVIQFEDFATANAFRLLRKYRDRIPTFNDDIQGTAAVTLAGILSALKVTGRGLREQILLFQGAGEAATGIADLVVEAMIAAGMDEPQARRRCWLVDSKGLVVRQRAGLSEHKRPYAHEHPAVDTLLGAVESLRPTAIIGVAAVGGAFSEKVVRAMASINTRPIVFALSNPTSKSECTAEQAYEWSGGRAIFACGSPFAPVAVDGQTLVPRQGNNSYIFPGVGLGLIVSGASRVTDEMFMAAAHALANMVTADDLRQGSIYPPLSDIREVSARIAAAVATVAYKRGLAQGSRPADVLARVKSRMYEPRYPTYAGA